jgi:uncharacterized protein
MTQLALIPFLLISFAIAAIIAVLYSEGVSGLRRFISRLLIWRSSIGWYALMIIGSPLVFYAGAALQGRRLTDPFPFSSVPDYLMWHS